MIDGWLVNVTDLAIYRPTRNLPAGDTNPANDVLIANGLRAIVQRTYRLRKGPHGEDVVVEGLIFLDGVLADGTTPLEVRSRDLVQYTEPGTGRLLARRAVLAVAYESLGPDVLVDHVELEV